MIIKNKTCQWHPDSTYQMDLAEFEHCLEGVFVILYFSNEMIFNENPVRLRMNYVSFFNDKNLIYRYYSYYDRTPIIEAMNENILAPETK